jgi:hypothetical protein
MTASRAKVTPGTAPMAERASELEAVPELFHRLNNHLGIILANAELLEAKATDETARARAGQVVTSVLDALAAARALRQQIDT